MHPRANESAAVATLKNLASAEKEFRDGGYLDRDGDGVAEFGLIAELCGQSMTQLTRPIPTAWLSPWFERNEKAGFFIRSGYCFQLYLSQDGEHWVRADPAKIWMETADTAEGCFLMLAWPSSYGNSGKRCFFVDQTGQVRQASNERWMLSGPSKAPKPELAVHPDFIPVQ